MEQQYAHQAGSLSSHKQDTGCTTDEGVIQLEQRVHQLNERVQQLNQESTSWMLSPSMAREQTVPTASQRSTETVTNQLPPLQPQFSTVARSFPLNSKRMKKAYLQRVAEEFGLPTNATGNDLLQMIEGGLRDRGHEPQNVQVAIQESPTMEVLQLLDAYGPFLEVKTLLQPDDYAQTKSPTHSVQSSEGKDSDLDLQEQLQALQGQVKALQEERDELHGQVSQLQGKLAVERQRVQELWQTNCRQSVQMDQTLQQKDAEIEELQKQLRTQKFRWQTTQEMVRDGPKLPGWAIPPSSILNGLPLAGDFRAKLTPSKQDGQASTKQIGKAPPVDVFSGEDPAIRVEDWFPSLERAASWNGWNSEEQLIQLAGYLRGKALMEWNLLEPDKKATCEVAKQTLQLRLDTGGHSLAAQDFRHLVQQEAEAVGDFIQRLERTFQIAYGQDQMLKETRDTLLHSQLQEGLRDELMRSPTVSGSHEYSELCLAAKNEEKRLATLKKRQQYHRPTRQMEKT